jgi:hypothetical protein
MSESDAATLKCMTCGHPVRQTRPDEGYDLDEIPWTHADGGGPVCDGPPMAWPAPTGRVSWQDLATLLDATRHVDTTPAEDAARLRLERALHAGQRPPDAVVEV